MSYQLSGSLKTLTHWQSAKSGGGFTPVERLTDPFIGFVANGMPYFFPFECWDPVAERVYKSRQSEYDSYTAIHPLLSDYYGYEYDVSQNKPLYSAYKWDSPLKENMYFSALYVLYEDEYLQWTTRDAAGGYGKYAEDHPGTWVPYTEVAITSDYTIKAGETYGIAVPKITSYLMLEGTCPKSLVDSLPEWLKEYPYSSGYYQLYSFEPPQLAPSLFQSLGKIDKNWELIMKDETAWKGGGGGFWGVSAALSDEEVTASVSGGYCGLAPVSISAHGTFAQEQTSALGSCVSPDLVDYMPSVKIPLAKDGIYFANTTFKRIYPIENTKNCYCDISITREPVSYGLTTGVLWTNEVKA